MKRRSFIRGATAAGAAAAAVAATGFPKPAISQGKKEFKMVTSWPKNFPGLGTAANEFARRVNLASGGKYTIRVYAGGELVHPLKCNDAVQQGTADFYHSADYYYGGKHPAYLFFTAVPFGFTANEIDAWIYHAGGQKLWDEVGALFGIKHLAGGNTGSQMGGWFRKEINSVEDFKGLKMRIPGLGGSVINKLGGTSVTLGGGEIMPALQAGNIDATEWVGPWNDLAFGFYKVAKYYYYPGFHEPGSMLSIGVNKGMWDKLSKEDQAMMTDAAHAANNWSFAQFNANNTQALETLINKHGVQLKEFSDDIYKAFGRESKVVLEETAAKDELTKKVFTSFMDFRKKALTWTKLSDQTYANKRELYKF